MFKPLANPESLIIIGSFSYLLTKSDQFGDTVMLAPESQMTSMAIHSASHCCIGWGLAMPFIEWLDLLESLTQSTACSYIPLQPQSFGWPDAVVESNCSSLQ
jgi:hypothetical protein